MICIFEYYALLNLATQKLSQFYILPYKQAKKKESQVLSGAENSLKPC